MSTGAKWLGRVLLAVGLLSCGASGSARQGPAWQRVLIGFRGETGTSAAEARAAQVRRTGGVVHRSFHYLPVVCAQLPVQAIDALKKRTDVLYIEEDGILQAADQTTPWGVEKIGAVSAWTVTTGAGINVALLDTGADYDHPDLAGNIGGGVNFAMGFGRDGSTSPRDWEDREGHGSHCAGIVAAVANDLGVVGVAPRATLWAVKVLGDTGTGFTSDLIQGLEWCRDHHIQIVSMSLTGGHATSLQNACDAAYNAGVLLIAAAGNSRGAVSYPAAYSSVIAVSAIDAGGQLASFSNSGPEIELAAPGMDIYSTYEAGGYATLSGTSMASPHVAGAAALIWSTPSLGCSSAATVRARLRQTARDLGLTPAQQGYGLVDAAAAVAVQPVMDVAVLAVQPASASINQGQTLMVGVTMMNVGNRDITTAFEVVLTDTTDGHWSDTQSLGSLNRGASVTLTYAWNTTGASLGDHTLRATAGPVAGEENPANNSLNAVVTIRTPPAPVTDIAITGLSAVGSALRGDPVPVTVTVRNVGNQDVGTSIPVTLTDSADGALGTRTVSGLGHGASAVLTYTWDTTSAALGDHTLTAAHGLADDDLSNNSATTQVTISERPAQPTVALEIALAKDTFSWLWRVTASVTATDAMTGGPLAGAVIRGHWSGVYSASVSRTSGANGQVRFSTAYLRNRGTVTFTVDSVEKDGQSYALSGSTTASISN